MAGLWSRWQLVPPAMTPDGPETLPDWGVGGEHVRPGGDNNYRDFVNNEPRTIEAFAKF
jgi:hypothetical protein